MIKKVYFKQKIIMLYGRQSGLNHFPVVKFVFPLWENYACQQVQCLLGWSFYSHIFP